MTDQLSLELDGRYTRLDEPLLTPTDAADLLVVRISWIYEAVRNNRLPCVRVGRHFRFLRSDLERWMADPDG
jgi:excisionase family DNA binding protein